MRQETGSNPNQGSNKVSIQLALDGHSFCGQEQITKSLELIKAQVTRSIIGRTDQTSIEFVLLTARTMLVPQELIEANTTGLYTADEHRYMAGLLSANGMQLHLGECAIASQPSKGVVAIIALNDQLCDYLHQIASITKAQQLNITTPLLENHEEQKPTFWVKQINGLLYIKVYTPTLQFAEVIAASSEEEIIYLFEMIERQFPPRGFTLRIESREAQKLKKIIGGSYTKVICQKI